MQNSIYLHCVLVLLPHFWNTEGLTYFISSNCKLTYSAISVYFCLYQKVFQKHYSSNVISLKSTTLTDKGSWSRHWNLILIPDNGINPVEILVCTEKFVSHIVHLLPFNLFLCLSLFNDSNSETELYLQHKFTEDRDRTKTDFLRYLGTITLF